MRGLLAVAVVLLIVVAAGAVNYLRPIPAVEAAAALPASEVVSGTPPALPWPSRGSAAVAVGNLKPGVTHLGLVASSGNEQPIPAASVTKVMTALVILEDKPLKKGESGPTITLTSADVQIYQAAVANKESVVPVQAGEQLTEFQALEGLLLPSGNNLAASLARWDAGSVEAFVVTMNKRASELHLKNTKFSDVSGANPSSMSTPSDLISLGMEAMKNEVFQQIVAMGQAELPVAGTVYNVDAVLGQSGIIGIKTGSGFDTGANFLFAANVPVDGIQVVLFGCVMGQPTLAIAFDRAKALIAAVQPVLHVKRVVARNQSVGTYTTPWGAQSDVISTDNVDLAEWPGMVLRQNLEARWLIVDKPVPSSTKVGMLHLMLGEYKVDVPVATATPLYPPGRFWRLTRLST
jgi:D-alanyl-D-alanine carboxypeptidase (penicillin-binding protein 5/6)